MISLITGPPYFLHFKGSEVNKYYKWAKQNLWLKYPLIAIAIIFGNFGLIMVWLNSLNVGYLEAFNLPPLAAPFIIIIAFSVVTSRVMISIF